MESRDLVSVSDESRDPFLRVSISKVLISVSDLISVSKATGLETLNIAKIWCSKISIIQQHLLAVFAGKKQPNLSENARNLKKNRLRSDGDIFLKKCTNFEVSSLGLGIFDEVSVSKF